MNQTAIQPSQLSRLAVIYVRQSTPLQVEQHTESQRRQYQLTEQAQRVGNPAKVPDDNGDQMESGVGQI